MNSSENSDRKPLWNGLRWVARIWAIGPMLFWAAEFIYPHVDPTIQVPWTDWLMVALLSISVLSLGLAWRREGLGGLLSVIFLALFLIFYRMLRGEFFPQDGLIWLVNVLGPALLFLIYDQSERASALTNPQG